MQKYNFFEIQHEKMFLKEKNGAIFYNLNLVTKNQNT